MRDSAIPGGGQTIVVDIAGVRRAAGVVSDTAEMLRLLGRRLSSAALPEMPAGVAAEVAATVTETTASLASIPDALKDVAQELKVRGLWAEVADRLSSGYPLTGVQRMALEAAYASGSLLRHGDPDQIALARAYAARRHGTDGRGLAAFLEGIYGAAKKGTTLVGVARFFPWMSLQQSWNDVAPGSPLADEAGLLFLQHFPTANNGLLGRGVAGALARAPGGLGRAGGFLSDASRATPYFRYGGIALSTVSTGIGVYDIVRDRNKSGAQLATDVTGTMFSASTTAFLVFPTPVTGALVLATGAAWGGAEAWKHHVAIEHAVGDTATWEWNHSAPGLLWNNHKEIGATLDKGVDLGSSVAGSAAHAVTSGVTSGVRGLTGAASNVKKGWHDVEAVFG